MAGGSSLQSNGFGSKGPTRQRPWFQLPPKVQIVPGILGQAPFPKPRVVHLWEGNLEVRDGGVFGHRPGSSFSQIGTRETLQIQIGDTNPNLAPQPHPPSPPPAIHLSILAWFVGHLWRGASTKSFASTAKTELARTVSVKMNQGGGCKNFGGFGWGTGGHGWGGGAGGQGRGPGRGSPGG